MAKVRIVRDPDVMLGKPTIEGTRLTVQYILTELSGGRTAEDLVAGHPRLTIEGVHAALAFAARLCGLTKSQKLAVKERYQATPA